MPGDYEAVKKILESNNITNIEDIEYGGECFDELLDYFADEIPYGVLKARTGMPDEWIYDKLCDLGFDSPEMEDDPEGLVDIVPEFGEEGSKV